VGFAKPWEAGAEAVVGWLDRSAHNTPRIRRPLEDLGRPYIHGKNWPIDEPVLTEVNGRRLEPGDDLATHIE